MHLSFSSTNPQPFTEETLVTMQEIPAVIIDEFESRRRKFVVVEITDDQQSTKKFVRTWDPNFDHVEIAIKFGRECREILGKSGIKVRSEKCLGGGKLDIDPTQKTIDIWGSSGEFGKEPDRQETASLIQTTYPDYKVEVNKSL